MSRSQSFKVRDGDCAYELKPTGHPVEPDKYLVPMMRRKYGDYRVYITRDIARFYTDETLPDFIKAQLAMMTARSDTTPLTDADVHAKGLYKHYYDPTTPDLGWRLSPSYSILVVTKKQLEILDSPCIRLDNDE